MSESKSKVAKPRAKKSSAQKTVEVIRIINPFDPRQHVKETVKWSAKKTLAEYFPLQLNEVVVSVNGKIILSDHFDKTYLCKSDNVVVCPVPIGGGGDGGKQILSIIAIIAIGFATAGAGLALAGSMGLEGAALTVGGAVLQAGIQIAGGMLVNAIFAPSQPSKEASSRPSSGSSYGVDGAKNTSLEGIPVPVCYGTFRQGGNIIGLYVENDGDTQMLFMLISAGEGAIASISDVELNDTPITDFKDAETQVRHGGPAQSTIPWFNSTITPQSKNQKLTTDFYYTATLNKVDKIRLDFVAPQGLCVIDTSNGATSVHTVELQVQYRAVGSTAWTDMPSVNEIVGWEDSPIGSGEVSQDEYPAWERVASAAANGGRTPVYSGGLTLRSSKRSAFRKSFTLDGLASQKYELRVKRLSEKSKEENVLDEVFFSDLNEIQSEVITYQNTALLGIKVRLNDQLSSIPRVTFINGGRIVQVYGKKTSSSPDAWYESSTTNPAWITWDMLTNRRFGGGMNSNRLDFSAFKRWADHCEEKNLQWNGVLDADMNVWDACQLVLRVGHAQLVNVGTRFTVVVEKAANPVMMFSVANMMEGSYKETWLSRTDRANEIDITYFDKEDRYKQRILKIYDPASIASGQKVRNAAITLYGVTDYETAFKEGLFQLNLNRYVLKTVSFSAPLEAIAATVGDLIYVQHDMTDWAIAGRFESGCTTSVMKLDREATMEAGKTYKMLAIRDFVERYTGTVQNVVGNSIFLTGFDGAQTVKRIRIGLVDLRVAGTFEQGGFAHGVTLDSTAGISVGQSYTLIDTDVIEEYGVVTSPGAHTTLTLQSPMSAAPAQFGNWMFGESDKIKSLFRIKSVTGSHEYKRDIVALQYDPLVYDFSRYSSVFAPVVPAANGAIGPVRDLELYEETYVSGESIVTRAVASWHTPIVGSYVGADVYLSKNGSEFVLVGTQKNGVSFIIESVEKGDSIVVKVVAFDIFGKRADYSTAPTKAYVLVGEIPNILVGEVTGVDFYWSGKECKVSWRYNSVTHSYEFGSEPSGADAGSLDPHFKDYEVRVYNADKTILRRTEHVTSNQYLYSYDKNYADGIARRLVFEVRMRDKFNNLGEPAILDAYNPPPQITGTSVATSFETATITYTHTSDPDFEGVRVYLSESEEAIKGLNINSSVADALIVYDGPDSSVLLPKLHFDSVYNYRLVPYDAFGKIGLIPSSALQFRTTHLNVEAIATGVLSQSMLIPALSTRINLIDAPEFVIGSVSARLATERTSREGAITALETSTNAITTSINQSITNLQTSTSANLNSSIAAEANTRAQAIIAEAAARSTGLLNAATDLLAEKSARETAVTNLQTATRTTTDALAQSVVSLTASTAENIASAVLTESTARASAVDSLASTVTTLSTDVSNNRSAIQNETTARSTAVSAVADSVTALATVVGSNTAAISTESTARSNALSAEATTRNQQLASYDATIRSYINNYSYSRATSDATTAELHEAISSSFGTNAAAITTEANTRATAVSAVANSVTTLSTQVGANTTAINNEVSARTTAVDSAIASISALTTQAGANSAAITNEASARTTAVASVASTVAALTVQVGDNSTAITNESNARTTAISSLASTVSGLSATVNTNNNDVNALIANEATARATAIASETTSRNQQLSTYDGTIKSYIGNYSYSKAASDATTAGLNTAISSAIATSASAISDEQTTRATAVSAVASDLATLAVSVGANTAAIATETTARVTAISSETTSRTQQLSTYDTTIRAYIEGYSYSKASADATTASNFTSLSTRIGASESALTTEVNARTTADSSLLTSLNSITAQVGTNTANISNESTVRASADAALLSSVNTLITQVDTNTAAISSETTARVSGDSAEVTARLNQFASYDGSIKSYISSYAYSKASSDATTNAVYNNLRSEFSDRATYSYVQSYAYTKAESNSVSASYANQVTARLDNIGGVTIETALNTQATVTNGLSAQYTVKIDNNGYVTGFGLASTYVNGTPISEFIVRSDTFAVILPGYSNVHPFTIGTVNGVPRVIISSALIGDASINNAQIGSAAINSLKIAGNAVTVMAGAVSYNYGNVSVTIFVSSSDIPEGMSSVPIIVTASIDVLYVTYFDIEMNPSSLYNSGNLLGAAVQAGVSAFTTIANVGPGYYTFYCYDHGSPYSYNANTRRSSITAILGKR